MCAGSLKMGLKVAMAVNILRSSLQYDTEYGTTGHMVLYQ